MAQGKTRAEGFDGAAAVTRSLLGYGVLVGPFYLIVGVVFGLTRDGFDFSRHALSLLMLGDLGWIQRANLIVSGLMLAAAALGFIRATRPSPPGRWSGILVGVFGICLVGSGMFAPDPMEGYPPGAETGEASLSGILHLAFGGIGFLSLSVAAFAIGAWFAQRGHSWSTGSRVAGIVIIVGFLGGAALATQTIGVVALWIAVVAGWVWLAVSSVVLYRTVPHPDADRRVASND